jgi:hypothetical protein
MRATSRRYRQEVYRLRSHPEDRMTPSEFIDQRDSNLGLYLSLIPFLALEYVAELSFSVVPTGVIFPVGYLLFWAFYYTYYKPNFLEENLSATKNWNLGSIPALVIGVLIWFLKVTVVELTHFIFARWITPPRPKASSNTYDFRRAQAQTQAKTPPRPAPRPQKPPPPKLPADVLAALSTLGLDGECKDWNLIHHRFRDLAKKFHPDLNQDLTSAGKRFIIYDGAYKKLLTVKDRYFHERRG